MDATTQQIHQQQDALLHEMGQMRVMRRGTLSPQRYLQRQARKGGQGACGPYFLWQGYREGRHFSQRVSSPEAERLQREIAARKHVEQLCAEYVRLGEALAQRLGQRAGQAEALKKGRKPRPKSARR